MSFTIKFNLDHNISIRQTASSCAGISTINSHVASNYKSFHIQTIKQKSIADIWNEKYIETWNLNPFDVLLSEIRNTALYKHPSLFLYLLHNFLEIFNTRYSISWTYFDSFNKELQQLIKELNMYTNVIGIIICDVAECGLRSSKFYFNICQRLAFVRQCCNSCDVIIICTTTIYDCVQRIDNMHLQSTLKFQPTNRSTVLPPVSKVISASSYNSANKRCEWNSLFYLSNI